MKTIKEQFRKTDSFAKELESAPKKASLELFLKDCFTAEELQEFENEILYGSNTAKLKAVRRKYKFEDKEILELEKPKLKDKILEFQSMSDVSEKFLIPDEEETTTFKALNAIQRHFENFKKFVFSSSIDVYKQPENTAILIKSELKKLDAETERKVLEYLLQEERNFYLDIHNFNNEKKDSDIEMKWTAFKENLKLEFLNHKLQVQKPEKALMKFEDYFPTLQSEKVSKLKELMSVSKGKKTASYIYSFFELGLLMEEVLEIKSFVNSFLDEYNLSGITKYLSKNEKGFREFEDENFLKKSQDEINKILNE